MITTQPHTKNVPLTQLCAEALRLHRQREAIDAQLKALKLRLISHARRNTTHLAATRTGGKLWVHATADGHSVRVSFPADSCREVRLDDEVAELRRLCAGHFADLFQRDAIYTPVPTFLDEVNDLLGANEAEQVIELVKKENAPRVSFDVKESAQ